jgi:Ca2+-binding RTX toxin-like protein
VWRSQINGTPRDDSIRGLRGDDLIYAGAGNDMLSGDEDTDRLYGESGNDDLWGGLDHRDLLYGSTGNDTYNVFDSLDIVTELAGQGTDMVLTTMNYTLPPNVEDLFLLPSVTGDAIIVPPGVLFGVCSEHTGSSNPCREIGTWAIGNASNNDIRGNGLANHLRGMSGNDHLIGGGGGDDLQGGDGNDVLEGFTADRNWWSRENDTLSGGAGADVFVIGISGRPTSASAYASQASEEQFPQYLGQGMVYITDFAWREGDKVEVFGEIGSYRVAFWGTTALVYWNGSALGYGSNELVAVMYDILSPADLIPGFDFI